MVRGVFIRVGALLREYATIFFLVFAIGVVWIPQLSTALFVDEAATHWMIKDGWRQALHRSLQKPGQSSLYAVLLSGWSFVCGTSEIALRIPSIIAGIGVCGCLLVLSRLRAALGMTIASGLVVLSPTFTFASTSARPYGLGLLLSVASLVVAQFAAERNSRALVYVSGAMAALSLYCHITFLAVIPVLLIVTLQSSCGIQAKENACRIALVVALCAVPVMLHHFMLEDSRISEIAVLEQMPSVAGLILYLSSVSIALVCVWLLTLKLCVSRRDTLLRPGYREPLVLGLALYLSSKLSGLLAAITINPTLLLPRYCVLASVGEALVAASLIAAIARPIWRRMFSVAFAVCFLLPWFGATTPDTAWLPVVTETRKYIQSEGCDVFALVGFAESRQVRLLIREPEHSFISSPLEYYQLLPATLLPAHAESMEELEYMHNKVFPVVGEKTCHVLLTWQATDPSPNSTGPGALMAEMRRRGCGRETERTAGLVTMSVWRCSPPPIPS